jgi:DNA-binding winged helix-turn-helix (wHTH) protein
MLLYQRAEGSEAQVVLSHDVTTLGRSESCAITVNLPTVSRIHARIEMQHDRYMIFDEGSANGTFVNGIRLEQGQQLTTGAIIWLGSADAALSFSDPEETLLVPTNQAPAPIYIDESARSVQVFGVATVLTPLEYGLLLHFAYNPGTVCTRESCFLTVWGQPYDHATCEDALNACVAKLRRNLRASAHRANQEPPQITTIQRVGFRLESDVAFAPRSETPAPLKERMLEA